MKLILFSPASQMGFRIGDIQYLVMNDGAVGYNKSIPVTFEVLHHKSRRLTIDETIFGK